MSEIVGVDQDLRAIISKAGLGWVIDQVNRTIHEGRSVETPTISLGCAGWSLCSSNQGLHSGWGARRRCRGDCHSGHGLQSRRGHCIDDRHTINSLRHRLSLLLTRSALSFYNL